MFRRAFWAAVCLWPIALGMPSVFAEEAGFVTAPFAPPPSPFQEETAPAPLENFEADVAGQSSVRTLPITPEWAYPVGPLIAVPEPVKLEETPNVTEQPTPVMSPSFAAPWGKFKDFSETRWRPISSGFQWIPARRDRFGLFSLTGGGVYSQDNWGGLSTVHEYGVHFLNGPVQTDMPPRLFDLAWGLHWSGEWTDGWSASLSGRVGLFTDFEDSVRDGWRFPAHAVVFHDWTEAVQGVAGVKFLDRRNLPPLPVLGVILRPDEGFRLEALFPEPRIAWRVHSGNNFENWISLSGEIGGGEWAIERSNTGLADVVTYNDYSAVLGFHHYTPGQHEQAFEVGYIFARDLEYRSGVGNFHPGDTLFLRLSSRF